MLATLHDLYCAVERRQLRSVGHDGVRVRVGAVLQEQLQGGLAV